MFGFLKPRSRREAEAFFAKAAEAHQQLRFFVDDTDVLRALSIVIVDNCMAALRRDRKYGDAYILAADAISFWAQTIAVVREDPARSLELASMAAFALKEWRTRRYFARNAARGKDVEERLLQIAYFTRPDPQSFDSDALDSRWRDIFFETGDARFRELIG